MELFFIGLFVWIYFLHGLKLLTIVDLSPHVMSRGDDLFCLIKQLATWKNYGKLLALTYQSYKTHTLEPRKYKLTHINDGHKYTQKHILLWGNWTLPLGFFLLQQYWFTPTTPSHPKYTYCTQPTSIKYTNQKLKLIILETWFVLLWHSNFLAFESWNLQSIYLG